MPETENNSVPVKTKSGLPRWVRSLTAAAAVLAILLAGSVTAEAFGFNLWKAVVQWTQETFHFGDCGSSNINNSLSYASLQEALEKGKVDTSLAPTWFPNGYELAEVKIEQSPQKKTYKAIYTNGEQTLIITVQDYLNKNPVFAEQSGGIEEEYNVSGITYHLFSNYGNNRAVWLYESYECDISGDISIDELKEMINSIQKG